MMHNMHMCTPSLSRSDSPLFGCVYAAQRCAARPLLAFGGQEVTTFLIDGTATVALTINDPDLWWPAGQGDQPLYDLVVTAGDAVSTRRVGLRKLELVTEQDDIGLGFKLRVNGRDIFCKGANWIPADALPSRITDEKTRDTRRSTFGTKLDVAIGEID